MNIQHDHLSNTTPERDRKPPTPSFGPTWNLDGLWLTGSCSYCGAIIV